MAMNEWKMKCVGLQWSCVSKRTVYHSRFAVAKLTVKWGFITFFFHFIAIQISSHPSVKNGLKAHNHGMIIVVVWVFYFVILLIHVRLGHEGQQ